jgi:hypothetical protein
MTKAPFVSDSIEICAPPATIFNVLADPRRHVEIDGSGTVKASVVGPERLSRGAKFGMRMRYGIPYSITNKVIAFDENREIAWRHFGKHVWRYQLEPIDDERTRVTESWDTAPMSTTGRWIVRRMGFPARTERAVPATLQRLKEVTEAT